MYVCVCKGITESDVQGLGQRGITCPRALASSLGIDDKDNCCGRCIGKVQSFVTIAKNAHHTQTSSISV